MSVEHRINDERGVGLALGTRLVPGACCPVALAGAARNRSSSGGVGPP